MHLPIGLKRANKREPYYTYDKRLIILDQRNFYIASIHADADEQDEVGIEEQLQDAHDIITAVNAFDTMLDALKKVESCLSPDDNDATAKQVRAAIALAEQSA